MARSSSRRGKLLLLGAAAVAVGVLLKRDKVAGLLPSRTEPYTPPSPGPSNYDAPGPVANTATPVPAPEPQEPGAIDEAAEEAAAAAEAANIGGRVSDYAGPAGMPATEAERPLAEAGEGEAEGQEQAEFDLERAAQPTAPGMSDTERQIEDTIEQAANPRAGETIEPIAPTDEPPAEAEERARESGATGWSGSTPSESAGSSERSPEEAAGSSESEEPGGGTAESQAARADEAAPSDESSKKDGDDDGEGGTDWRTWSGRSINP